MEPLFFFLLIMTIVTLVGHGIWVVAAFLIRKIFDDPQKTSHKAPDRNEDLLSFSRILASMYWQGKLTETEHRRLRELAGLATPANAEPEPTEELGGSSTAADPEPIIAEIVPPQSLTPPRIDSREPAETSADAPAAVERHPLDRSPEEEPEFVAAATAVPNKPRRAMGAVLQSFLASNNIRWGELLAGLLIVICSVGLVISLWSTMQQTHRLLPSLVFLLGTAGIEAAGLYTLRKWNLKETSRAVLVIVTLLIPLNVVAGIALATGDGGSVQLTQPLTLAVIAIATIAYSLMLWLAGRAIFGRDRWQMSLAVGGPSFLMPFIPAAVRHWNVDAAWLNLLPSAVIGTAIVAALIRKRDRPMSTPAGWRFGLLAGMAIYTLAVVSGFFAFHLPRGLTSIVPLTFGMLPAVLALMACGGVLRNRFTRDSSSVLRLMATATIMIAGVIVAALFPATLGSQTHLIAWAALCAGLSIALAIALRVPTMLYVASATAAIGLLLIAGNAIMGTGWEPSFPLWRRLVSGESAILLPLIAAGFAAIAATLRKQSDWMRPPAIVGGIAAVLGLAVTAAVAIGPVAWSGSISATVILAILLIQSLAIGLAGAWKQPAAIHLSGLGLAAFSIAACRPETQWLNSLETLLLVASSAASLLLICMFALALFWRFLPRVSNIDPSEQRLQNCDRWHQGTGLLAIGFAVLIVPLEPIRSAAMVSATAIVWILAATRGAQRAWFACGQAIGLLGLTLGLHAYQPTLFTTGLHWIDGTVFWMLVAVAGSYALLWHAIQFVARTAWPNAEDHPIGLHRQLGFASSLSSILLASTTALIAIGLYIAPTDSADEPAAWIVGWQRFGITPFAAILFAAATTAIGVHHRGRLRFADTLRSAAVMLLWLSYAAIGWLAVTLSPSAFQVPTLAAATLAFAIAIGISIRTATIRKTIFASSIENGLMASQRTSAALWAGIPTTALLVFGIWQPLISGGTIDPIAAWVAPAIALLASAWFAVQATWYRRADFSLAAAAVGIIGIMTAGIAAIGQPAGLAVNSLHLLGLSCFALAAFQRIAEQTGVIRCLQRWQQEAPSVMPPLSLPVLRIWPDAWPTATSQLASIGIAASLISGVVTASEIAWNVQGVPALLVSTIGNAMGLTLVIAAGAFWFIASRRQRGLVDAAGWMTLAAPTVAIAWTSWRSEDVTVAWGVMLSIWSAATVLAAVVSVANATPSRRSVAIPLVGSGLLIASGLSSVALDAPRANFWLIPWAIGTLVGLAVTLHRGSRRGIRLISGVPIVSGILLTWAVDEYASNAWQMIVGNRYFFATILIAIVWLLFCGVLWRLRFVFYKRSVPTSELLKFKIDTVLLFVGTILLAILTPAIASNCFELGVHAIERMGNTAVLLLPVGLLAIAASTIRWDSRGQVTVAYLITACLSTATVMLVASHWQHDSRAFSAIAGLTLGMLAAIAAWLWPLHRMLSRFLAGRQIPWRTGSETGMRRELSGLLIATLLFAMFGTAAAILEHGEPLWRWVWIGAIIACAIAIGRIGSNSTSHTLRTLAVGSLCIAAMFGSVADVRGVDLGQARALAQTMRLFIASVWLIPLVAWVAPRLLALDPDRWSTPIRRSAIFSASVATIALFGLLAMEVVLRTDGVGIPQIPTILVVGTSLVIALFSLLALLIAIAPGKFLASAAERLTIPHRQGLVYAAQVLMLLAVANKLACQPDTLGLREYWPYIVMALAFVSAGLSTWAQRREDAVLLGPLRNSALFLPLIPLVGFWLTGRGQDWIFADSEIQYNVVLLLAAVFYLALSALWPGDRITRVAGIIAANAALWVTLTQNPGWGFLQHPQLWLIPPAACVLGAVHAERKRLQPQIVTAVRYAATLTIYISSTADMIVQQIGSSIWGPIVLILLAFAGIAIGVVMHVRAFLYLGTGFVVVGLISMVWHAGRAIDQVWPWWAFGITMGLMLLAGLMAIEKHKETLRRIATRMNQWEA
ncbi:hypothetical protein CA51_03600 [Rosistilla oblonga]|uniref:hypothetical protein n=1 Tax=Rosistilla oblonga TaxID=2527990 RepID=UPI001189BCAE|nr:hypothetical protein [Rosistilla oblonga]QDV10511.1 hypothetical protein CA51_03600 [Rosistilla oblonga]